MCEAVAQLLWLFTMRIWVKWWSGLTTVDHPNVWAPRGHNRNRARCFGYVIYRDNVTLFCVPVKSPTRAGQ